MRVTHKTLVNLFLLPLLLSNSFTFTIAQGSRPPKLTRTHKSWLTFTKHVAPVRLPSSRELVTVGDTLYLLNAQRAVIWKWDVGNGQDILDRPIVNSQGIIYGIALDG